MKILIVRNNNFFLFNIKESLKGIYHRQIILFSFYNYKTNFELNSFNYFSTNYNDNYHSSEQSTNSNNENSLNQDRIFEEEEKKNQDNYENSLNQDESMEQISIINFN